MPAPHCTTLACTISALHHLPARHSHVPHSPAPHSPAPHLPAPHLPAYHSPCTHSTHSWRWMTKTTTRTGISKCRVIRRDERSEWWWSDKIMKGQIFSVKIEANLWTSSRLRHKGESRSSFTWITGASYIWNMWIPASHANAYDQTHFTTQDHTWQISSPRSPLDQLPPRQPQIPATIPQLSNCQRMPNASTTITYHAWREKSSTTRCLWKVYPGRGQKSIVLGKSLCL